MRCGLRGFVVLTLGVGISSCGNEYEPHRVPGVDDGGTGGIEVAAGGTTAIDVTNGGASAASGIGQGQAGANDTTSASSIAGASAIAGAGSLVSGGGSRPAGVAGSSSVGGWPGQAGARPFPSDCGLPASGPSGIAKPAGTTGNLRVLNWAGFKAAATFTFDDANSSQIANYTALNALGVPLTFFLWTSRGTATDPTWARAVLDGHELANHTQSHATIGTAADVDAATSFIEQRFGVKVWTMASPYGNASYVPLAEPRFLANRGVASGWISANGSNDPFQLPCYIPPEGASATTMNTVLDGSRTAGAWQIVLVHG
ncbi:MAG TPA: polysaccharide deacetylase family protein, partial [Polyangiaceae bacterium]